MNDARVVSKYIDVKRTQADAAAKCKENSATLFTPQTAQDILDL
jgi:hypothetical protein